MFDSTLTYVCTSTDHDALDGLALEVERLYGHGVCVVALGRLTTLYVDRRYPTAVAAWDYARELYDAALQGRSAYRAAIRGNVVDADAFNGPIHDALDVEDMIADGLLCALED